MSHSESKTRVLVVDDDLVQIKLVEKILTHEGYDVMTTTEADQGLQAAMNESPDIILLDVMMPIINGYNFCKLLKAEDNKKDIAIIMVTARDDLEDIEIGLEMGANAYLTKPINTAELLKTLKIVHPGKSTQSEKK